MATRERPGHRGRRRIEEDLRRLAAEYRRTRTGAGLSLRDVEAATDVDHVRIWRFENGRNAMSIGEIGSIGAVLGLDVRLRAYPAGDPIRDAGQARLLERLRSELHPSLGWRTEMALPIEGDLRAWDAVISGRGWRLPVEAETVLTDIQAVERRVALKRRDGNHDHVPLLVADTRRNRAALLASPAAFTDLAASARVVLAALGEGRDPGRTGVVFL